MISGVEGRGLESRGHLSLQGQRRLIVMRPTFPTNNPFGLPTPPLFLPLLYFVLQSPSILHLPLFFVYTSHFFGAITLLFFYAFL